MSLIPMLAYRPIRAQALRVQQAPVRPAPVQALPSLKDRQLAGVRRLHQSRQVLLHLA